MPTLFMLPSSPKQKRQNNFKKGHSKVIKEKTKKKLLSSKPVKYYILLFLLFQII